MTELFGLGNSPTKGNVLFPDSKDADLETQKPILLEDPALQNTLDEPVSETIKRDLYMIYYKLRYVINPRVREEGAKELRNWDLWGPLILCLALAFILSIKASNGADVIFGTIFIIIWGGASILTLNAKFLGGKISFFQSVCVLGYCVFPILISACGITLVEMFFDLHFFVNAVICGVGFFWAVVSSIGFMQELVSDDKKMLAAYPVMLFYMSLSWYVLLATSAPSGSS